MTSQPKDGWDIASVIASIIGFILIPLVIAVSAWYLESSLRESELAAQEYENERNREAQRAASDRDARLRTFEVAVGILQQDPESNRNEISALRRWAIKIFVDFSAENVPEGVKKELERKPLPRAIPSSGTVFGPGGAPFGPGGAAFGPSPIRQEEQ